MIQQREEASIADPYGEASVIDVDDEWRRTDEDVHGDPLFGFVRPGLQDGYLIDDLGWSGFSIREELGVIDIIALASHGTAEGFLAWMEGKAGVSLHPDREPATITLYEAWQTIEERVGDLDGPWSFRSWATSDQRGNAVVVRPVAVHVLRHRSWPLLVGGRVREFFVAAQRSVGEAVWRRSKTGAEMTPNDLDGDIGFVVRGRPRGQAKSRRLTWPTASLDEAIAEAERLKRSRVAEVMIGQMGSAEYPFKMSNREAWARMARLDRHWGRKSAIWDLARATGLEKPWALEPTE